MTDNEKRIAVLESRLATTVDSLEKAVTTLEKLYVIVERIANHLEYAGVVSRSTTTRKG